ncbi:hypothetical protein GIW70_18365 [Pseudomonas syringae]|nr:hypothetical protein [Pseudomonas syringae]
MDLMKMGLNSLEALHIGQHLDAQISDGDTLPTLEDYRFIAQTNTGCFFVFILDACQHLHPLPEPVYTHLKALMLELAVYYRFVNDYCDINHIPHFRKKGFAPDLDGGPKSFLMILANDPLSKRKRSESQKRWIIFEWGNAGVFTTAMALMEDSFAVLHQQLEVARRFANHRDFKSLEAFLLDVRFRQDPADNYYDSLIR